MFDTVIISIFDLVFAFLPTGHLSSSVSSWLSAFSSATGEFRQTFFSICRWVEMAKSKNHIHYIVCVSFVLNRCTNSISHVNIFSRVAHIKQPSIRWTAILHHYWCNRKPVIIDTCHLPASVRPEFYQRQLSCFMFHLSVSNCLTLPVKLDYEIGCTKYFISLNSFWKLFVFHWNMISVTAANNVLTQHLVLYSYKSNNKLFESLN